MKNKIFAFLDLLRPLATLQLSLWVLFGSILAFWEIKTFSLGYLIRIFLATFLGIGGGMALNDWIDRQRDRKRLPRENVHYDEISRLSKSRPLAQGIISDNSAFLFSIVCLLFTSLLVFLEREVPKIHILFFVFYFIFAEVIYQKIRQKSPSSFLIIASLIGLWPVLGYFVVKKELAQVTIILFLLAFFWEIMHNQIADLLDLENDCLTGLKTAAVLYGKKTISYFILFSTILVFFTSLGLYFFHPLNLVYLFFIFLGWFILFRSNWQLFLDPSVKNGMKSFIRAKQYLLFLFLGTVFGRK